MYRALYRKYRPKCFSDVVGQSAVTETLKNSVKFGRISHAYLFCGTRGTGKTTCAKILAAAVNCEHTENGDPCMECESCKAVLSGSTDIIEMDAASNRGVNDVRDLKEQIAFLPSILKYRVYIIDEVHMLTQEAFNALLKTLEEPPAHVIFILATTEAHKLPATILSRCQRYDFKRIESDVIKERLLYVAKEEGIKLSDGAAGMIARLSDGGLRDALSLLDQCYGCCDDITEDEVASICGIANKKVCDNFAAAVAKNDASSVLEIIDGVYRSSLDLKNFCEELIGYFRNIMVIKAVRNPRQLIELSDEDYESAINTAKAYSLKKAQEAISVLSAARESMARSSRKAELELAALKLCNIESETASTEKPEPKKAAPEEIKPKMAEIMPDGKIAAWQDVLEIIKTRSKPLYGGMSGTKAYLIDNRVLIDSDLPAFREMVNADSRMREIIKSAIAEVLGKPYNIGPYKKKEESEDPLSLFAKNLNNL